MYIYIYTYLVPLESCIYIYIYMLDELTPGRLEDAADLGLVGVDADFPDAPLGAAWAWTPYATCRSIYIYRDLYIYIYIYTYICICICVYLHTYLFIMYTHPYIHRSYSPLEWAPKQESLDTRYNTITNHLRTGAHTSDPFPEGKGPDQGPTGNCLEWLRCMLLKLCWEHVATKGS